MSGTNDALQDDIEELLAEWDELQVCIDRMLTALPGNMSRAAEELEASKLTFRQTLQDLARDLLT